MKPRSCAVLRLTLGRAMRTERIGGATGSGMAFVRLGFLLAVFAGMLAFAATKHSHDEAALQSPVVRPV